MLARAYSVKMTLFFGIWFERRKVDKEANKTYMKTETCKLYSRDFWIFLPKIIKIDLYNSELCRFKVCAFFLRHSVLAHVSWETNIYTCAKISALQVCNFSKVWNLCKHIQENKFCGSHRPPKVAQNAIFEQLITGWLTIAMQWILPRWPLFKRWGLCKGCCHARVVLWLKAT